MKKSQEQALTELRQLAPQGSHIFVTVNYIYPGNLQRILSFYSHQEGNNIRQLDTLMAQLFELKRVPAAHNFSARMQDVKKGLLIDGVGMDMGLFWVYKLAKTLYDDETTLIYDRDREEL